MFLTFICLYGRYLLYKCICTCTCMYSSHSYFFFIRTTPSCCSTLLSAFVEPGLLAGILPQNLTQQCRAFNRALQTEKLNTPTISRPLGAVDTNAYLYMYVHQKFYHNTTAQFRLLVRHMLRESKKSHVM